MIKIQEKRVLHIQIHNVVLDNMEVVDEWEGFLKLKGSRGTMIVFDKEEAEPVNPFDKVFSDLFQLKTASDEKDRYQIIMASPNILQLFQEEMSRDYTSD